MKRSSTLFAWAAGTAVSALLLSGCGPAAANKSQDSGGKPQPGGDLVMVRADPVQTLMPTLAVDNASIWTLEELFDTLLLPSQDGKSVSPDLATSWKQSPDGLSWTFQLRKDVKFSDGHPMTSKDVKFSLDKASVPSNPFGFIDTAIASVSAPDDYTVVVKTKQPYSPLPAVMAIFSNSIVPFNYGGVTAAQFAQHPIGTGPFTLDHWTKGKEVKLVKNPHYFESGKPYLNSVTFPLVSDSNTRANQVQGGQAHINEFPAYSSIQALQGQSGVKVGLFPSSRVDFMQFNNKKTPFNDVHVRRAIAYAVDKQAIIKAVLFGHADPAGAYMSPNSWSHNANIKGLSYDMAKAKQELAQSSTPNGFTATISVNSGNSDENSMAQIVQSSVAQLGIKLNIQSLDPSALVEAKNAGNYEMGFGYDTTDIVDPDEIIRFTGVYDGGSTSLWSFYDNKAVAAAAAKATTISDQAQRKALYDQIQAQWDADQPMVPLYYSPEVYSYSTAVHSFHPFVTGNYNLVDVWMRK